MPDRPPAADAAQSAVTGATYRRPRPAAIRPAGGRPLPVNVPMHVLNPTADFPPEVARAVTGFLGRPPFDGVRLAVELAAACGALEDAEDPGDWADEEAGRLRPRVLRCGSEGESLQTVWRHLAETPAEWCLPARVGGLVLHAVAWRLGVEADFVLAVGDNEPPALRVSDPDCDRVLSPLDGCLRPAAGEAALRPRAVVKSALGELLSAGQVREDGVRTLSAARLAAFLSPADPEMWVEVADAALRGGEPGTAYELAGRLRSRTDGAAAVREAAGDELARRN